VLRGQDGGFWDRKPAAGRRSRFSALAALPTFAQAAAVCAARASRDSLGKDWFKSDSFVQDATRLWKAALLLALVVIAGPARADDHPTRTFLLELTAARGTALVATEYAIGTGRFHEANGLMGRRPVRLTLGLAAVPVAALVSRKLDRDGHHGAAKWFRRGALALAGADAGIDLFKLARAR